VSMLSLVREGTRLLLVTREAALLVAASPATRRVLALAPWLPACVRTRGGLPWALAPCVCACVDRIGIACVDRIGIRPREWAAGASSVLYII
jgi:hypothetical protein